MSGRNGFLGCLAAFAGIIGIFVAITISFTFYLIPVAFLLFVGSLILISLALGPAPPPDTPKHRSNSEDEDKDRSMRDK